MSAPVARVCEKCSKPLGTLCFRYVDRDGQRQRGYFHPACFRTFIEALGQ